MFIEEKQNFQTSQDSSSIEFPKNEKEVSTFIKKFYKSGIPLELVGYSEVKNRAIEILSEVGLDKRLNHFPSQLSGGEQQRVAIARALAIKPKIILADEPTGNLDQKTGIKIIDLLFNLNKKNKSSLIIVTHSIELANKCQRQVKLVNGKTIES